MNEPFLFWNILEYFFAKTIDVVTFAPGELAEWSIAAVLKTVVCNRTWGSNP
jgi:hypothetical protein